MFNAMKRCFSRCPILDKNQSACFISALLTRILASWEYVAETPFIFLIVKKKREEVRNISQKNIKVIVVNGVIITDILSFVTTSTVEDGA